MDNNTACSFTFCMTIQMYITWVDDINFEPWYSELQFPLGLLVHYIIGGQLSDVRFLWWT